MYLPGKVFLNNFAPVRSCAFSPQIVMHHTDDIFSLWSALEKESNTFCNVPFWAIAWPAAQSLCSFFIKNSHHIKGKSILDLGCGCGIVGITCKLIGASQVTLNDIDPLSIHVAQQNAERNQVDCHFSTEDLTLGKAQQFFDCIITADCFYEKNSSNRLFNYLLQSHKNGSQIIIADGQRPFTPHDNIEYLHSETVTVDFDIEGVRERKVTIFSLNF